MACMISPKKPSPSVQALIQGSRAAWSKRSETPGGPLAVRWPGQFRSEPGDTSARGMDEPSENRWNIMKRGPFMDDSWWWSYSKKGIVHGYVKWPEGIELNNLHDGSEKSKKPWMNHPKKMCFKWFGQKSIKKTSIFAKTDDKKRKKDDQNYRNEWGKVIRWCVV